MRTRISNCAYKDTKKAQETQDLPKISIHILDWMQFEGTIYPKIENVVQFSFIITYYDGRMWLNWQHVLYFTS